MWRSRAVVNGELRPSPSSATLPGEVASAINVPAPVGASVVRPLPTPADRPSLPAKERDSGLSRQASSSTMLTLVAASVCWTSRSTSKSSAVRRSSLASVGMR